MTVVLIYIYIYIYIKIEREGDREVGTDKTAKLILVESNEEFKELQMKDFDSNLVLLIALKYS
jgi:hypothetical protein